jgi:hypothetical protein
LFAESEVKQSLKDLSKKRTNGDGFGIGGKLLFGYDRSKLENKRIHWLMMNKQPLLEQYLTGILTV